MNNLDHAPLQTLAATIVREKLWASDEETEAWLQTPTGQRIASLIAERRREDGSKRAG